MPPFYNQPTFARHLDAHGISWRWYSSDVGTLRMADELYCLGHHDKFAYFTTTGLPWKARLNWRVQADIPTFLEDAAAGTLPSVSWIDPSFGNFNPHGVLQNDDHPPADVTNGQDLVLAVYHSVAIGPQWDKTARYGVRVPAIIVSPWVPPRSVSKTLLDHTSVIKTILLPFCAEDLERGDRRDRLAAWLRAGHPHYVGRRVAHANDLGELLTNPAPRPAPAHDGLIAAASARAEESDRAHVDERTPDRLHSTDLQRDMAAAARVLKGRGHPAGRP